MFGIARNEYEVKKSALRFSDSIIGAFISTIRCIAGIIKKFTLFLARWALIGVGIRFKGVPTT
jgi:hypothetical protein